eukprot:COSAG02_NODE_3294_length_6996_cov_21.108743_5_plen_405_part_00
MPNPGDPIELFNACQTGDTATAGAWLGAGGDPNARHPTGFPAWWQAIAMGQEESVQQIVDWEGTDLELKSTSTFTHDGSKDHTALSYAAYYGQLGVARRLLRGGADAQATGRDDRTALEWAEASGEEAVAQLLREHLQQQQQQPPPPQQQAQAAAAAPAPAQQQVQPEPWAEEGEPPAAEVLRAELAKLKLKDLRQRAREAGMSAAELEAAMDTDEPEDALISYVMQAHAAAAVKAEVAAALQAELQGLKLKDLRQRAREAGMSSAELEAAMDTDEPESTLISYVMQAHTGGAPGAPAAAAAGDEPEPELARSVPQALTVESHGITTEIETLGDVFDFVFSNKTNCDAICLQVREQLVARGLAVWQQKTNIPKDSDNWFSEWFPSAQKSKKIICFVNADYLTSP